MVAAIYARKSTEQNVADEQKSTARQVDHARQYAARKGWSVSDAHVFEDDGISGAEFAKRPGFLRLMNAVGRRPPFRVLIVSELSRLGREQFETGFALKQLSEAGVRIFSYMEDREVAMDSAIDRFLLSAANFGAELEREKASLRSHDKARQLVGAGHVAGGKVFGYRNVRKSDRLGRHSHTERHIDPDEAATVRRIFELRASGVGQARIARTLNADGDTPPSPRGAGRGRGWAASTVREILFRELYRGRVVWNRQRKRTSWGRERHSDRPADQWVCVDAPQLRIIDEALWSAAHGRMDDARIEYERVTGGRRRPRKDHESKYLLVGFASCGVCGGGMHVRTRSTKRAGRAYFYACTNHYSKQACPHRDVWPLQDLDAAVLASIGGEVLDADVLEEVVAEANRQFSSAQAPGNDATVRVELQAIEAEQERLAEAVAIGGSVPALARRLEATERRRVDLLAILESMRPAGPRPPAWREVEGQVRRCLADWRAAFVGDLAQARDAFRKLLSGRIRFTPVDGPDGKAITFEGKIGLDVLLSGEVINVVTRAGIEPATL